MKYELPKDVTDDKQIIELLKNQIIKLEKHSRDLGEEIYDLEMKISDLENG